MIVNKQNCKNECSEFLSELEQLMFKYNASITVSNRFDVIHIILSTGCKESYQNAIYESDCLGSDDL